MKRSLAQRMLIAVRTDAKAVHTDGWWTTRCIHCKARVGVRDSGEPLGSTTLEHIVPRAWFAKRRVGGVAADLAGPDDPRNLALACARCNQGKGKRLDPRGPGDERASEVVAALLARRLARYREPGDSF